ncbi:hypothetical protein HMPREF9306_01206 [Propionimicrobium lymphophilum ACS-093-V-SCH5]|uniref:Uncharacterized protein n=1 Tax=Propionimicrobium lymphophilum ACS-093-V-SCH5 TaxID=883161 RepID=S2VZD4_9ACTN|nr:hypothetical protein HMPREF9306_01206 [Propionimicrobium lymphophilum ACS-093-V-SCH5]
MLVCFCSVLVLVWVLVLMAGWWCCLLSVALMVCGLGLGCLMPVLLVMLILVWRMLLGVVRRRLMVLCRLRWVRLVG